MVANAPGIIATQSTHKQLASFSQASQIHVKDSHIAGQQRRVEHRRFNECFLLHASTSPFYPLFASLDVGAQMMKGRSGEVLWDDTIRLGIELRKKLRAVRREFEAKRKRSRRATGSSTRSCRTASALAATADERRAARSPGRMSPTDELAANARYWELAPGAAWHGFAHVAPGYAMTDPNKLTLLTPGFDRATGAYAGARHSGAGRRAIFARKPHRRGKERPQLAAVPADAGRRSEQGRHAAQRAGRLQEAA